MWLEQPENVQLGGMFRQYSVAASWLYFNGNSAQKKCSMPTRCSHNFGHIGIGLLLCPSPSQCQSSNSSYLHCLPHPLLNISYSFHYLSSIPFASFNMLWRSNRWLYTGWNLCKAIWSILPHCIMGKTKICSFSMHRCSAAGSITSLSVISQKKRWECMRACAVTYVAGVQRS